MKPLLFDMLSVLLPIVFFAIMIIALKFVINIFFTLPDNEQNFKYCDYEKKLGENIVSHLSGKRTMIVLCAMFSLLYVFLKIIVYFYHKFLLLLDGPQVNDILALSTNTFYFWSVWVAAIAVLILYGFMVEYKVSSLKRCYVVVPLLYLFQNLTVRQVRALFQIFIIVSTAFISLILWFILKSYMIIYDDKIACSTTFGIEKHEVRITELQRIETVNFCGKGFDLILTDGRQIETFDLRVSLKHQNKKYIEVFEELSEKLGTN